MLLPQLCHSLHAVVVRQLLETANILLNKLGVRRRRARGARLLLPFRLCLPTLVFEAAPCSSTLVERRLIVRTQSFVHLGRHLTAIGNSEALQLRIVPLLNHEHGIRADGETTRSKAEHFFLFPCDDVVG